MKYFEHDMPIHPTSMTRWRKKIGEDGMETLLLETIQNGFKTKAITPGSVASVNVDTTVREKFSRKTAARLSGMAKAIMTFGTVPSKTRM